jgi:hypothetical protein
MLSTEMPTAGSNKRWTDTTHATIHAAGGLQDLGRVTATILEDRTCLNEQDICVTLFQYRNHTFLGSASGIVNVYQPLWTHTILFPFFQPCVSYEVTINNCVC